MGWEEQQRRDDENAKIMVNGGYNKTGPERTDFLIFDPATGEHQHMSIGSDPGSDIQTHHDYR